MTTTKTPFFRRSRIVLVFLIANAVLWAVFWGGFLSESTAYPKLQFPGEGAYISAVVAHRAVSPDLYLGRNAYYQVSFIPNLPSFLVTRVLFNVPTHGYRSPELYLGTTVAGYELICWMFMSFLQWCLIGRVIGWLMRSKTHGVTAAAQ